MFLMIRDMDVDLFSSMKNVVVSTQNCSKQTSNINGLCNMLYINILNDIFAGEKCI